MTGRRVQQYEILEKLGEGGMGVVYKARDTELGRLAAIKALPERFNRDGERVARFSREAQVLASLSHPNVAAVYGLSEADGQKFLAMELAEGETLSQTIARGRIAPREALEIARQMAEGVAAAHEKGIIHRDLKPANVMVSADGKVKVLDFGLAKALDQEKAEPGGDLAPTISVSQPGAILGTTAYMSPEQARGRPVDRRTDVWAFGCVLFEMLTGERAFRGETATDTLAQILEGRPRFEMLPDGLPERARELLSDCLVQDPRRRLNDLGDARLEIERVLAGGGAPPQRRSRAATWAAAGLAAGILVGSAGTWMVWSSSAKKPDAGMVSITEIDLGRQLEFPFDGRASTIGFEGTLLSVSLDGRSVVFVGSAEGRTGLYLRRLDRAEIRRVEGSEDAIHAFFSPDGSSIGFLTNDKVKSVAIGGGQPTTLCNANAPVQGTWGRDGFIYFSETQGVALSRVPASGGKAEQILRPKARQFVSQVLPDCRHALATWATSGISADGAEIRLVSLKDGASRRLLENGYDAKYVDSGHLIFGRAGDLHAVEFDAESMAVKGVPRRIVSGVRMQSISGHVQAGVSANGIVVYAPGGDAAVGKPVWIDRTGKIEPTDMEERLYGQVSISSDGRYLAVHVYDSADYILVEDLSSGRRRTIKGPFSTGFPAISPKGDQIAFVQETSKGEFELMCQRLDEGSPPVRLRSSAERMMASTWSMDGEAVGGFEWPSRRLFVCKGRKEGAAIEGRELKFPGSAPAFSPVKDWIAARSADGAIMLSNLDGDRSFSISQGTGAEPVWCAKTGELFYREGNRWFATKVRLGPSVEWEKPRLVFETEFVDTPGLSYAVSPDGQRLLVVKRVREMPRNKIAVLQNWQKAIAESH